MVEPTTVNKGLIIPNTGSLPGTWGSTAINPDMVALDGMLGGFTNIALSNTNVTLTVPPGFIPTPSGGPTQSQNSLITFQGTLTGNVTVTFPMPGYYIVNNLCAVGAFAVRLASNSPGKIICAPPGEAVHIFCNGVDMFYVGLGRIGEYLDLATTVFPAWIAQCTVQPYLACDGTVFSAATFPALAAYLGGTTLPDLRGRTRSYLNLGTGRITVGGSGINGNVLLSAGGGQSSSLSQANLPVVNFPVNIPAGQGTHAHQFNFKQDIFLNFVGGGGGVAPGPSPTPNNAIPSGVGVINATLPALTGSASSGGSGTPVVTMPPTQISGITLIRAG